MLECNELGIYFISENIPKKKAEKVQNKMDEIISKYIEMAVEEFDKFLESQGLESTMGVVIKKEVK